MTKLAETSRDAAPVAGEGESESGAALFADALVKSYRGRRVVDHVSFEVRPGEVVGLLGPNGAGKTTSFNMVVGLIRPDGGRVHLGGTDLTRCPIHRRARAGLGYLPQESSVFRRLSVRDNLLAVLELNRSLSRRARADRASSLIEEFELGPVASSLGEELSGGERRRVEIARCLAADPRIVLLDEPFAGIDPIAVTEIQGLIARLASRDIGVLITDHNVRETLGICSRAYILVAGRVLEHGSTAEIAASDRARAHYLGRDFRL
ncbi:MAG: LPS export ABC transporter ATP-binding protein [Deltaproteobacteria bacterium]|nr:LPS export ABC transporter ATP-binding protein [Deltaproteobacteria bacterium]